MRVSMRDPRIAADVVAYIERMGFSAHAVGDDAIEVAAPEGVPEYVARVELDLYLALWRALEERHDIALIP
jgi:hypothetical protein